MSSAATPVPTVVSKTGAAAAAIPMKGGVLLSPLPYGSEGGKRRKSRKMSKKGRKMTKKALKALKKFGGEELEQVVGGADEIAPVVAQEAPVMEEEGGRRRRKSSKKSKKSKKSRRGFLY